MKTRKNTIRICLVEDERLLLETLRWAFHHEEDFEVCAALESAEVALRIVNWTLVDVLLVDLDLPGMNGADLVFRISNQHPALKILVLTGCEDRPTVLSVIRRGACGYLVKGRPASEIIRAVRELVGGGAPMSPPVARMIVEEMKCKVAPSKEGGQEEDPMLTGREVEILGWTALGHTRGHIGKTLGISPATVHSHMKNIYGKLSVHNRTEAINRARDLNIL